MAEVASNYGKSTAQIALAWGLAHRRYGFGSIFFFSRSVLRADLYRSVIAKSTTEGRVRASFEAALNSTDTM
jgi:aryl-alcohol dehydrogenase-like predicted oxidoreductase